MAIKVPGSKAARAGESPGAGEPSKAAMSKGKTAYESRRAAEAGMSLEAWLKKKTRAASPVVQRAPSRKESARRGLMSRLLDRAHKPL